MKASRLQKSSQKQNKKADGSQTTDYIYMQCVPHGPCEHELCQAESSLPSFTVLTERDNKREAEIRAEEDWLYKYVQRSRSGSL